MYLIVFGLTIGIIIGTFLQLNIPPELARYTAIGIVGILDSLFGAIRASIEKKYSLSVLMSGLLFNLMIAVLITFVGDKLNLDLYLAVLIAFTIRILSNIGIIKTSFFDKFLKKDSTNSTEGV